jgi:hypothetical protein
VPLDQVLVLGRIAQSRAQEARFGQKDLDALYEELALPAPQYIGNVLATARRRGLLAPAKGRGAIWAVTPEGRERLGELMTDMDLAALVAEAERSTAPSLGGAVHPVIPPTLAPPGLIQALRRFLAEHPFERNVFGMTRFPDEDEEKGSDPVASALKAARDACARHGLEFHLASDRAMHDDLWMNVMAHTWASHYGIAFFEDRRSRGLNYNMTIEVGGMLVAGRRCLLLKDESIKKMPTDLVGKIYKAVDLVGKSAGVSKAVHEWIRVDLGLGHCPDCR